jgi:hypothetical protein
MLVRADWIRDARRQHGECWRRPLTAASFGKGARDEQQGQSRREQAEGSCTRSPQNPAGQHHARRRLGACGRRAGPGHAGASTAGAVRAEAEHPRHLRRRHRPVQHQRLHVRPDGLPHGEHRPHRARRHDVHRLLRRSELHGGSLLVHHRAGDAAHRPEQSRGAGRDHRPANARRDHCRAAQAARLRDRPFRQEPPRRPQ